MTAGDDLVAVVRIEFAPSVSGQVDEPSASRCQDQRTIAAWRGAAVGPTGCGR